MTFTKTNTAVTNNNTNVKHTDAEFKAHVQTALNHLTAIHRAATLRHLRDYMLARHYALGLPTQARRIAALTTVLQAAAKRTAVINRKRDALRDAFNAKAKLEWRRRQQAILLERAVPLIAERVPHILQQRSLMRDIDATRGSREGNPIVVADYLA
ncbi:hypothetical protein LTR17_012094 [Elasticomyces elasticus]|nr:hypothetical protein LTR17_012094 [Elasticomyces elasticus]